MIPYRLRKESEQRPERARAWRRKKVAGRERAEAGGEDVAQLRREGWIIRVQSRGLCRAVEFSAARALKHMPDMAKARGSNEYRRRHAGHEVETVDETEGTVAERGGVARVEMRIAGTRHAETIDRSRVRALIQRGWDLADEQLSAIAVDSPYYTEFDGT